MTNTLNKVIHNGDEYEFPGGISNITTGTTSTVSGIRVWTDAEYSLITPEEWQISIVYSGGGGWWRLPAEYQEVEYIQSSWTQYIDSWISWANGYIAEAKFIFTDIGSTSDDCYVLWSGWTYPNYAACITKQWTNWTNRWRQCIQSTDIMWWDIYANTEYVVKSTILTSWNSLEVNWSTIGTSTLSTSYDNWYNMYIFAMNSVWTASNSSKAQLYYLKIWQNDESNLIRDYVPCYRIADDEIWLYDLVNDVFYTNDWTWTFTKWPDVN